MIYFYPPAKNIFTGFVICMAVDKVSFTSRINFVNNITFDSKFLRGTYVDFRTESDFANIQNFKIPWFRKNIRGDIVCADEFYTDGVRTCTSGGIIDTKNGLCAGFHFFDSKENFKKTSKILDSLFKLVPNPDRALILGSKKLTCADYSIPFFEKIYEGLAAKIKDITMFKEHKFPYSETDLHYDLKNDTWTIHSMYRPITDIKIHSVDSKFKLETCFKEIKIADGDSIHFV